MGKFRSCSVNFKGNKEVFRDGELVNGVMMLDVIESFTVKGVRVYCFGEALTKWRKEMARSWDSDQIGQEKYFAQVLTVFGRKGNVEGPNQVLTAGKHRWSFSFRLPNERLPSSFEGEYGAVRWFLRVEVDKPFPSINNKWYRAFTVLSNLNVNEPVYKVPMSKSTAKTVSKALGLGNAGTLTLSIKTDRFGYCPGEHIVLAVTANNESSRDMGKVSATLVQDAVFTANDETKHATQLISSIVTEMTLGKGMTLTMTDLLLPIPAVPPSTRKRTCHIISCRYSLKVTAQVPWGLNLDAVVPIAIGTVPLGKRVPPPRQPTGQASATVVDPATDIRYVPCETGITPCSLSHNNFPNFAFRPCTAFASSTAGTINAAATTRVLHTASGPSTAGMGTAKQEEASAAAPTWVPSSVPFPPPSYTDPPATLAEEMELPPAYEEVVKMDEQFHKTIAETSQGSSLPVGKTCAVLLVRFPDITLTSFRDCIQQEHNNLLDAGQAFLAALAPQPIMVVDTSAEEWPQRAALAVMVFPDMRSGEEWMKGPADRGDAWHCDCDAIIMPANWSVPDGANGSMIFTLSATRRKEESEKERWMAFSKEVFPIFAKLRTENGGVHQVASSKVKTIHGKWLNTDMIALTYWPKLDNYCAFKTKSGKADYVKYRQEFRTLFDNYTVLFISEDVTSLSTQPTLCFLNGAEDEEVDDESIVNSDSDEGVKAENLLTTDDRHFSD